MSLRKSDKKAPRVPWYANLFCRHRLATAKSLATELAAEGAARWERLGLSESDLPVEWRPENLVAKLFRSLYRYSADQVKDEWRSIFNRRMLPIEKEQLIKELATLLRTWQGPIFHNPSPTTTLGKLFSFPSLTKQEELNLLEPVLRDCTLEELTTIKRSLLIKSYELVQMILAGKLFQYQLRKRDNSRQASSKGSIGHDRLNVKTLSPGEWKRWVAVAFTREMKPWSPCPQTFRLSNDHSSSAVTELPV